MFAPAGQSSQMIIGATNETDKDIMFSANSLYKNFNLKRVYYSAYVPVSYDTRLPSINTAVPVIRENRLYQTDWLMRFYGFKVEELLSPNDPNLDIDIDPKLGWAIKNLDQFPIDINKADLQLILRVPGIGIGSANKIVAARKFQRLNWEHLKKIGVAISRAKFFIICSSREFERRHLSGMQIKQYILAASKSKFINSNTRQLQLF